MVDEHFKDVTKDFNQCPDVLVHSVAFFCLAMQSYGGLSFMLCNHVRCDAILLIIGAIIYDSSFGYIFYNGLHGLYGFFVESTLI